MPNNVVRFVIRGRDLDGLRRFYASVFGWQLYNVAPDYLSLETNPHGHDEAGNDISPPVLLEAQHGALLWRYESETAAGRPFVPGIPEGGLGLGDPGVLVFIQVEDLDRSLQDVTAGGGAHFGGPVEIPGYARIATFTDPEGNRIGLQQPLARP